MSKATVISVIDKKIKRADDDSRKLEKDYHKSGAGDFKDFINSYL
jgi:hypothetical protein